jgi:hypothetical protein
MPQVRDSAADWDYLRLVQVNRQAPLCDEFGGAQSSK